MHINYKRVSGIGFILFAAGPLLLWTAAVQAELALNMRQGVTPISREVYDLHMIILWICVTIAAATFAVMFYSMFKHRKSKGAVAAEFHENTTLEIVWTVLPALILVVMAVPATKAMINIYNADAADLTIKVTGHQWKWQYEYLDQNVSFFSNLKTPMDQIYGDAPKNEYYLLEVDKPLVLPVNKKIRFVFTSADVLHSWWVPDLGWKQDTIPGFINENWALIEKPGVYRGQCAELCGRGHGFMPIEVHAVAEEEFQTWLASFDTGADCSEEMTAEALLARGEQTYGTNCAVCHQPNGEGLPPTFPSLVASDLVGGPLEGVLDVVLNGREGTAMPAFAEQLDCKDIAAAVTYVRNAWGRDSGDTVQPADVAAKLPSKQLTLEELMQTGAQVYGTNCAMCHQPNGEGLPPTFPGLVASEITNGDLRENISVILHGREGTVMPAFGNQLNDDELAAVTTYVRNAWGRERGDAVQPAQIKEQRD